MSESAMSSEAGDAGSSLHRALDEYSRLPGGAEQEPFRWGFMGAWGKATEQGAQHACMSVHTTTLEWFLSTRTVEEVAQFAALFTNPSALRICGCVFRHGGEVSKQDLMKDCDIGAESLDSVLQPLMAWHLVEWKGEQLAACGQGVNFAMTLTGMAIEGYKQKSGHEEK